MIYVLDRKDFVVGVLSNDAPFSCPYFDDFHIENIESGLNTYEFSVPASHETASQIEVNGSVIVRDLDDKLQIFSIKQVEEVNTMDGYFKEVFCEHLAVSELLTDVVRPKTMLSSSLNSSVAYILAETDWELGENEIDKSMDVVFEQHITVLEALHNILDLYDAEVQFEVIFEHGKIQKKLIHVKTQIGSPSYKVFSYTKDLGDVTRKEDSDGVITALVATGKGDEDKKLVTLFGLTRKTGDYETDVDNDYVENVEALQNFGKNGKHLFGTLATEATNQIELFDMAVKELKERSKPRLTYGCKVVSLERFEGWDAEKVRVGDVVRALDYSFSPPLLLEARVLELKRSYTDSERDEITLGDYRPLQFSNNKGIQALQKKILEKEALWEATAYKVEILSSNGLMFKSRDIQTVLEAKVYRGAEDMTDNFDANQFKWTRVSLNTAGDIAWNTEHFGGTKTITVTDVDVNVRATFNCEVNI